LEQTTASTVQERAVLDFEMIGAAALEVNGIAAGLAIPLAYPELVSKIGRIW
jgi:hypothetical protein